MLAFSFIEDVYLFDADGTCLGLLCLKFRV